MLDLCCGEGKMNFGSYSPPCLTNGSSVKLPLCIRLPFNGTYCRCQKIDFAASSSSKCSKHAVLSRDRYHRRVRKKDLCRPNSYKSRQRSTFATKSKLFEENTETHGIDGLPAESGQLKKATGNLTEERPAVAGIVPEVQNRASFREDSTSQQVNATKNRAVVENGQVSWPQGEEDSGNDEREDMMKDTLVEEKDEDPCSNYGSETVSDIKQEAEYVTKITVPRQRYISTSKDELLKASSLFLNQPIEKMGEMCEFLQLIFHSKLKFMLEELRADYWDLKSTSTNENLLYSRTSLAGVEKTRDASSSEGQMIDSRNDAGTVDAAVDFRSGFIRYILMKGESLRSGIMSVLAQGWQSQSSGVAEGGDSGTDFSNDEVLRRASAQRFQKNFLALLSSAQFEGLSPRDLELTAALNSDYLLTLPIAVDWKRASESRVIIYKRGYTKEQQRGLHLGAKADYVQSALLKKLLEGFTTSLAAMGRSFQQMWSNIRSDPDARVLAETVERWVEEPLLPDPETSSHIEKEQDVVSTDEEMDLPIWTAAQHAIPRYEAVLSSAGSRGLLLRRVLVRMGLLRPKTIPTSFSYNEDSSAVEPHLRSKFISRVSVKDLWLPASKGAAGGNIWKRLRTAFSVFVKQVTLQEPAFQELVLLFSDNSQDAADVSSLRLQMYRSIPLPDLMIVFPTKKLSFRLIDIVRLDATTLIGLAAFLYNYRFEGVLSSPSAFVLDVIAASALVVFVIRAALGYKQTWDRYQLLVNKTLYEKSLASGFGVIHFLMDASEEQQYKEAIIAFSVLSKQGKEEGMSEIELADACERFLYYRCKEQTKMSVESALSNLVDLGLVYANGSNSSGEEVRYKALAYDAGLKALKQYWESIPSRRPLKACL